MIKAWASRCSSRTGSGNSKCSKLASGATASSVGMALVGSSSSPMSIFSGSTGSLVAPAGVTVRTNEAIAVFSRSSGTLCNPSIIASTTRSSGRRAMSLTDNPLGRRGSVGVEARVRFEEPSVSLISRLRETPSLRAAIASRIAISILWRCRSRACVSCVVWGSTDPCCKKCTIASLTVFSALRTCTGASDSRDAGVQLTKASMTTLLSLVRRRARRVSTCVTPMTRLGALQVNSSVTRRVNT